VNRATTDGLDVVELHHLLTVVQDGVVSRRQLRAMGGQDFELERLLRRRELVVVHPGVYVNHTGALSWQQRGWAAVLACWPAALAWESALPNPLTAGPVHVAVQHGRTLQRRDGVVIHRTTDFDDRVMWIKRPPRIAVEHAVIDVAAAKPDPLDSFRVIADACQSRQTTAAAVARILRERGRVPRRQLMLDLLDDFAAGACSVLEQEYRRLERAHGLPRPDRQLPDIVNGSRVYRDAPYRRFGLVVELDGKAFHDSAVDRDRDFERDLETAVSAEARTVRLTYGQVFRHGCRTIERIATLLERGGWRGTFTRCPSCP
jgi:hypothetical protein